MENKIKIDWSGKSGLLIVLLAAAGLTFLSVISYFFFDKYVFGGLIRSLDHFDGLFLIRVISLLGKIWVPIWLLFVWAFLTGRRQETMVALIAIILLSMIVPLLKDAFNRSRPRDVIEQRVQGNEDLALYKCSIPSGDTASIFAIGTAIMPFIGLLEAGIIFILAISIGALRVISLAHYPSDVFAGAAIGILIGYAAYFMAEKISFFKNHLIKILSPVVILITIIMIPLMAGLYGRRNEFILFLKFYLPAMIILFVIFKSINWKKTRESVSD